MNVEVAQTYPPHSPPPPRHLHPSQDEAFTVLSGSLHAVVGDDERELLPGDRLDVPRGTPHRMWATADGPTVVLWRTSPALRTGQLQTSRSTCAASPPCGAAGRVLLPTQLTVCGGASAEARPPQPRDGARSRAATRRVRLIIRSIDVHRRRPTARGEGTF